MDVLNSGLAYANERHVRRMTDALMYCPFLQPLTRNGVNTKIAKGVVGTRWFYEMMSISQTNSAMDLSVPLIASFLECLSCLRALKTKQRYGWVFIR